MKLMHDYALAPSSTLLVGDGIDDAEAAEKCGFHFAAAAYGYGDVLARSKVEPFATLKTFSAIRGVVL